MFRWTRTLPLFVALALVATPVEGQMSGHPGSAFMDEIAKDAQTLREKIVGLAQTVPHELWDWRPDEGIRSFAETFQHIAADNLFIPAAVGLEIPAWSGIVEGDYMSVRAYEERDASPAEITEQLIASFDLLDATIMDQDPGMLLEGTTLFGRTYTAQGVWMLQATHVHEHLGQLIAYARTNGVKPPWAR